MGFFKNIFGNKAEDDASVTSKPDPETKADTTAQPVETKPESPPPAPKSQADKDRSNADSDASQKNPPPAIEQEQSVKVTEKSQVQAQPERKQAEGPPPLKNVIQFKSVSVSSVPPMAKNHKVIPPEPPKGRSSDEAKASVGSTANRSIRESAPKNSSSNDQAKPDDKKSDGGGTISKDRQYGFQQTRVRAFGKSSRDSLPVSQNKTNVVGAGRSTPGRSTPKSPPPAPQSLKEKLIASADAAASSRIASKPKTEARVFRNAMTQAKEKSISSKELEIDLKSAVEWAFELAPQGSDARSKAAKAVIEDESKRDEIEAIFADLVKKRAKGIRDFALELSLGLTPKRWVTSCQDAVGAISQAANALKRTELTDALLQFEQQLDQANQQLGPNINPSLIADLNNSYANLVAQMPEGFGVGDSPVTRERLLVESLLYQVTGVGRNIVKQIESDQTAIYRDLCTADAKDIARKFDIDETVANAIKEKFSAFQKTRESIDPDDRLERAYQKLGELSDKLEALYRDFCRADARDDSQNKRNARRSQSSTLEQIDLLLVDLGETELFRKLRPLPVQKKIEAIKIFLETTDLQLSATRDSSPVSREVTG